MTRVAKLTVLAAIASSALVGLSGCAQESTIDARKRDGGNVSEQLEGESEWGGDQGPSYTPTAQLPATFPSGAVPFPPDSTVFDAGERTPGTWFVVLNVPSSESIDVAVTLLKDSGFRVLSSEGTGTQRVVTLRSDSYDVTFLTVEGADGALQLSYDVTQVR